MSRVVVCGSLNMDVVVESMRRPHAGETLLGAKVSFLPGGKGLNQAVAAARLGMAAAMAGAIGHDAFGNTLRGFLADNDVDSSGVRALKGPTRPINSENDRAEVEGHWVLRNGERSRTCMLTSTTPMIAIRIRIPLAMSCPRMEPSSTGSRVR